MGCEKEKMNKYTIIKSDQDFHTARANGVGSSDIPILAGYTSKYYREINGKNYRLTPYVLWLEKTGRIQPFSGNDATYWGNALEKLIANEFCSRKNLQESAVIKKSRFVHPLYGFAIAHPDIVWEDKIQEIKTARWESNRKENQDYGYDMNDRTSSGIPASVYCQVQWQLFCSDIREAGVSVLINTSDYREYGPILYNKSVIEQLLARADKFWWHVTTDTQPTPESMGDVNLIFPDIQKKSAVISGDDCEKARTIIEEKRAITQKIRKLEEMRDERSAAIAILLRDNQVITDPYGRELAKQTEFIRRYISIEDIEKNNQELYAAIKSHIKTTKSRRVLC